MFHWTDNKSSQAINCIASDNATHNNPENIHETLVKTKTHHKQTKLRKIHKHTHKNVNQQAIAQLQKLFM